MTPIHALRTFEAVYHLILDVGYLAASVWALRIVQRRRQPQHLAWIIPALIDAVVSIFYRMSADYLFFTGRSMGYLGYVGWGIALKLGQTVWIIGLAGLLKLVADETRRLRGEMSSVHDPSAWPPPPSRGMP